MSTLTYQFAKQAPFQVSCENSIKGGFFMYDDKIYLKVVENIKEKYTEEEIYWQPPGPLPAWLSTLPVGSYTSKELATRSGTSIRNVQKVMKHHCKRIEYVSIAGKPGIQCIYHLKQKRATP